MIHLLLSALLLIAACQPLAETTGELSAYGDGKRVYLQMMLGDFRVKKASYTWYLEHKVMPAKLHALYYDGIEISPLSLNGLRLGLEKFITFRHVVFSWRHQSKDGGIIYTCHLPSVSLGEQRDIIAKGSTNASLCFEQQVGTGDDKQSGNYVQLLAEHCVSLSNNKESRFVFLDGKDFACDVSDNKDGSIVLQASCLASESANNCLGGKIRACAADNVGFPKFVEAFKARVAGGQCNKDYEECSFEYTLKTNEIEQNNGQDTGDETFCQALAATEATGGEVNPVETEVEPLQGEAKL